jgi:hypothetical protein
MEDGFERNCWLEISTKCDDICSACEYGVPFIKTLEGPMLISPGDYIAIGPKGERYPIKPDIFELTYEKVDE